MTIDDPSTGQILQYNGTQWQNTHLPYNLSSYDFGFISGIRNPFQMLFQFTPIDFGLATDGAYDRPLLDLGVDGPQLADYIIIPESPEVPEGSTVKIRLKSINIPDGTRIPYTLSGVTLNDLYGVSSLYGTFEVNNNVSEIQIRTKANLIPDLKKLSITSVNRPEISATITLTDFEIPEGFDGEDPSAVPNIDLDGGLVNDLAVNFTFIADGGVVIYSGIFAHFINGGSPFDIPTVIINGGFEISMDPASIVSSAADYTASTVWEDSIADGREHSLTTLDATISGEYAFGIECDILDGGLVEP